MGRDDIAVSVVVPAFRAAATLRSCVEALLDQDVELPYEVIVVQSGDRPEDLVPLTPHPRLQVIEHRTQLSPAAARNAGVARARGAGLAFTDADAMADRAWLRTLVVAAECGDACIAGAIVNGTPQSSAGTAEYLMAFLDLHPARPVASAWHGATCNLFVPRPLWERYGPFAEDMLGGEDTVFTATAHYDRRLRFCPAAVVTHMNRTDLKAVVARQYSYGLWTAHCARRAPYHHAGLVRRTALAPLLGAGRLLWVYSRARRRLHLSPVQALRTFPLVAAAMVAWTAGLAREGLRLDRARRGRPR